MARTVWRFTFPVDDEWHEIALEPLAIVIHVDAVEQPTAVDMWVELDPEVSPSQGREFRVFGTGHDLPDERVVHRGTALTGFDYRGQLVWHLYERA